MSKKNNAQTSTSEQFNSDYPFYKEAQSTSSPASQPRQSRGRGQKGWMPGFATGEKHDVEEDEPEREPVDDRYRQL